MTLASKSIDGLDLEGSALALWQEFLAGYFDGNAHDVGPLKAIQFPAATLRFQESNQPQPLAHVGISIVWVTPSSIRKYWSPLSALEIAALSAVSASATTTTMQGEGSGGTMLGEGGQTMLGEGATGPTFNYRQERAEARCSFIFLIRATTAGGGTDDNSQQQVQSAAGLLFGLLQNAGATSILGGKGLHHIRPNPPRMAFPGDGAPGADLGYRLRVMSVGAMLRWPVVSQSL